LHILYIHQHFAVPHGSSGTRSYEFARRWVRAGHKVTIITGYYDIGGLSFGRGLVQRQVIDGINVIIVGTKYSNKQSFIKRIISFLWFMFLSVYVGLATKNVNVIYATSTPLTVGIPAVILKFLKGVPFVFEVRDQWPEIPIEMGVIKNQSLIKVLLWLEKMIYNSAVSIVALSPGMADGIRSVLRSEKNIVVVPNSCDTDIFRPDVDGSAVRQKYDWDDKLVFLHFGAMGKANGLDFVVEVAERLKDNRGVHFVIVGDGSEKAALIDKAKSLELENIEFLDPIPKSELPGIVAACDVSMVIFASYPILEHNSANKFFDSLSAGKPILLNYSGWQRRILEGGNAGFGCEQFNIDEFVEKVLQLNSDRKSLTIMAANSRRVAEEMFDRNVLANKVLKVIDTAIRK